MVAGLVSSSPVDLSAGVDVATLTTATSALLQVLCIDSRQLCRCHQRLDLLIIGNGAALSFCWLCLGDARRFDLSGAATDAGF